MSNFLPFNRYGLMLITVMVMVAISHHSVVRPIEAEGMVAYASSNNLIDTRHNGAVANVVGGGFAYSSGQVSELGLAAPKGPKPILQVNPTSLTFNATKDESNPVSQFFTISRGNTVPLEWTVSENKNWLSVDASAGTNEQNVNVLVVISGLDVGTYNGQITVKGSKANNSPQVIEVTLNVAAARPTATNTNTSVPSTATNTPVPPTATNISVPPTNTPTVASTDTPTLVPTSITTVQPTNIPTFTPVPLLPILQVDPTNLIFNATQGSSNNPGSQPFAISNGSSGTLNWMVSENKSWLSVDTLSGINGDVVNVLLDVNGLVMGIYSGQITVIATGAANSPRIINVTLNVVAPGSTATPDMGLTNTPTLQVPSTPTLMSTDLPPIDTVTPTIITTPFTQGVIYLPILIKSVLLPTPTPTQTPLPTPTQTPLPTFTPTPSPIELYVETKNTGGVNLKMYDKNSNVLLLSCTLPAESQSNVFIKSYCGQFLRKGQLYKFEAQTNKCGVLVFEVHINQIMVNNTIQTWCN